MLDLECLLLTGERTYPKPTFRAEGDHSRDVRRRRERALVSLPDLQPHAAGIGPACSARRVSSRCRGRGNWKTAPRGSFAEADSWPSGASMLEPQIASPLPPPPDL